MFVQCVSSAVCVNDVLYLCINSDENNYNYRLSSREKKDQLSIISHIQ